MSPLEFLVVGYYNHYQQDRHTLLQLYRADPQQALRQVSAIWPSPRAEMVVRTEAFFDIDANQIFVNTGAVDPDEVANVLAHEFWHALANVRSEQHRDGTTTRTTGFWTEVRSTVQQGAWRPVDETVDGGIPTYLMNEAVAVEMELAATGREHPRMSTDLRRALQTLQRLFEFAGRERVIQLYLESRNDDLKLLARQAVLLSGVSH